ncbi:hypothetical protein A3A46_02685 [Candidatus Roizmanbacteria bacterium RIFCSPLOWO2_01_FULL_37_13]|uniref:Large ribosomal subunit protein uL1 n=1 Tax=Candidatus Roizmanbacteria bacterium RIFCSPHIGHO2_02_FULL_38_11 TaxID=1802039 RepID=A0A1F7H0E3_9BACT|nr:MAG: hypothetical protein A3C25_01345 [Candidatus Roizmanbacteria bacterium RIFCSPHIGHO2_02_FULL_38_11]OGK43031.1 MAG: hypothetical protein A3A46_02685 [Candidatus Roizmanbacteria bacterium RIFCSPLOWO2_01_FULL_37_13]
MGKIRTRTLGLEDVEKEQKQEQKRRSAEKKSAKVGDKHKIRAQGLKGGERMVQVDVAEEAIKKMEKAKKILEGPASVPPTAGLQQGKEKAKKIKKRVRGSNYKKAKREVDKFYSSSERTKGASREADKVSSRLARTVSLSDAIKTLKKIKYAKFDESVELHINVDKEGLKGEVELPHSTGKSIRVKIVDDKVLDDIEKGELHFDVLITHPQYMPRLARFAKVLGPKGLMPNPKAGTISDKPEEVAKKFSKGSVRWKTEAKAPIIHQMIGKISFEDKALVDNASAFLSTVGKAHIQSAFIKTTMSPSIRVDMEKS